MNFLHIILNRSYFISFLFCSMTYTRSLCSVKSESFRRGGSKKRSFDLINNTYLLKKSEMTDRFGSVELAAPIEAFHVTKTFNEDTSNNKVNLGIGVYRTNEGQPWVLPVVKQAELQMANDSSLNHEYLNVLGLEEFTKAATSMLLGADSIALMENRAFGVQVLSGTGGLRVGAEFLAKVLKYSVFYSSNPTWGNHKLVFQNAGFKECREYRYWSQSKMGIDIEGFLEDLRNAPENSVIILHVCAHNPTGCDPTEEQWQQIADVMEERKLFPFFDSAYQGFASGDLDKDAWSVRYFVQRGFEVICAQSFAKNFGLYNERIGNLTIVLQKSDAIPAVKSQLTVLIRAMYSNPPNHGARIVTFVLSNPQLYEEWKGCIKIMSSRIISMREALYQALKRLETPGTWEHITSQIGMFSYTGLNALQSEYMTQKHHIYMLKSGRISMCGLRPTNVDYVAKAIHDTVTSLPQ